MGEGPQAYARLCAGVFRGLLSHPVGDDMKQIEHRDLLSVPQGGVAETTRENGTGAPQCRFEGEAPAAALPKRAESS